MLVGVQLAPEKDFSRYDRLIDLGVDHLSFCLEFWNPKWFAEICPGKEKMLGQQLFLDAMEYCAKRMPKGAVSGEIIAGIEPVEDTLAAIDYIAGLGAFPTVCVFRPDGRRRHGVVAAADVRRHARASWLHVYEACRRTGSPSAPRPTSRSASSSIPTMPRCWRRETAPFWAYEAYRRAARVAAAPLFAWRRRPRSRRIPGVAGGGAPAGPAARGDSAAA